MDSLHMAGIDTIGGKNRHPAVFDMAGKSRHEAEYRYSRELLLNLMSRTAAFWLRGGGSRRPSLRREVGYGVWFGAT